ncbi:MAG: zinc ribbon domain-containing protein [Gemmatimonadaceae bacterium]
MHADVEALLAVQADDVVIYGMEDRLDAIEPRLRELDRERDELDAKLAGARGAVAEEEKRHRAIQSRVTEHRQLRDRNTLQMNTVRTAREATAATTQLEQVSRFLAADETELERSSARLAELRETVARQEQAHVDLTERQEAERAAVAFEREALERELAEARKQRDGSARHVSRSVLARYDRIRGRNRSEAVMALRGISCSNCDTMIPMQRRSALAANGGIEPCEACGVLLYAGE